MPNSATLPRFCGQIVGESQLELVRGLANRYPQLSRTELAATACELLGWLRANGQADESVWSRQNPVLTPSRRLMDPALHGMATPSK